MDLGEYKVFFDDDAINFGIQSIHCIWAGRDKLFQRQCISFNVTYPRKKVTSEYEEEEEKECDDVNEEKVEEGYAYDYEPFLLFGDLKFYGTKENPVFTLTVPNGHEYLLSENAIDLACCPHRCIEEHCQFNGRAYIYWDHWKKSIWYRKSFFITVLKELNKRLSHYPNGHIIFENPEFSQYFTKYELKGKVYNFNDAIHYFFGEPFCAYYVTGKCKFTIESEEIPSGTKSMNYDEHVTDPYQPKYQDLVDVEGRYIKYKSYPTQFNNELRYSWTYIMNVLNSLKQIEREQNESRSSTTE